MGLPPAVLVLQHQWQARFWHDVEAGLRVVSVARVRAWGGLCEVRWEGRACREVGKKRVKVGLKRCLRRFFKRWRGAGSPHSRGAPPPAGIY